MDHFLVCLNAASLFREIYRQIESVPMLLTQTECTKTIYYLDI